MHHFKNQNSRIKWKDYDGELASQNKACLWPSVAALQQTEADVCLFCAAVWVAAGRAPRSTQRWQGWAGPELPTKSVQGTASAKLATATVAVAPPCSHLPLGAPNYMMVAPKTSCVFVKDWRLITESVF